jgi:outer membrane protein assembly factor BamE
MKKLLILIALLLPLSGCSYFHVHKMDIEQGNVLTAEAVNRVHIGMTTEQVKDILGTPVLINVFDTNRKDYVYTYKPGYGDYVEKYISFVLSNGRVSAIRGNLYSQYIR